MSLKVTNNIFKMYELLVIAKWYDVVWIIIMIVIAIIIYGWRGAHVVTYILGFDLPLNWA